MKSKDDEKEERVGGRVNKNCNGFLVAFEPSGDNAMMPSI